jgi:TP901 family phage tail tape measure protein
VAFSLGRAEGELALKYTGHGAATQAEADITRVQAAGAKGGQGFDKVGRAALVAGAAVAGGLALAVNAAANFEQRMSGIQAVSGATADQMELIRAKALQLGKDTKFSASEAAQAMEELSKAGLTIPEIMNGAADATVALAAAGEIELPQAATIAANAMNQFGLSAQQLPKVADLIAGAANASAIDVNEFSQSMQQAGAAAHLAGVSFPDLATSIALMGNAGIKGSDAGTSLKTMLLNLNPATKKQSELMKKLGIITEEGGNRFFDASGKAKSMADIAQVLQDSLKGMTQQQKLATLETLFGSDAIRAAAVVSGAGAKGFNNMAAAMDKVKAADVAATRMNNLKGQIEQMKGSLETAAIIIGTALIPSLTAVVKFVTGLINAFANLSPQTQRLVGVFAAAAATFLLVFGTLLKLVSIARNVASAFTLMWAAAGGPATIIIAAIIAIVAVMVLLYNKVKPVHDAINALGRLLLTAFTAVKPIIDTLVLGFQNFIRVLQGASAGGSGFVGFMGRLGAVVRDVVIPNLIKFGQFLLTTFGPIFTQVKSIILGFINSIRSYFQSIAPMLATVGNAIRAVWNAIWPPLLVVVRFVFGFLLNYIMGTLKLLAVGIRILLAGIANIFRGVFNIIGGIVRIFLAILTGNWRQALQGLLQVAKGIWQLIKGVFQTILGAAIVAICVSALKTIGAVFKAGFNAARAVVTGSMNAIRAVVSAVMGAIRGVVSAGTGAVRAAFSALNAIRGVVSGIMNGVLGIIRNILGSAAGVVTGALSRVVGAVAGFAGRMFAAGANIVGSLISGLTSRLGGLMSIASKVASVIAKVLPGSPVKEGPLRALNHGHAGGQIIKMLVDGINARRSDLIAAARSVSVPLGDTLVASPLAMAGAATGGTRSGAAAPALAPSGPGVDALASAVLRGLTGARLEIDKDGVGRIVASRFIPGLAMGGTT